MSGETRPRRTTWTTTAKAIVGGDRVALGRAITLIESAKPEDQVRAQRLLENLLPRTGKAIRVGISGVPGAGKSTLIDQLGLNLVSQGHRRSRCSPSTPPRPGAAARSSATRRAWGGSPRSKAPSSAPPPPATASAA